MSRTDIDAATFADYLRQMCGDGSVEWCYEPMQTSVLLDMANMLDENAKLLELVTELHSLATDEVVYIGYDRDGMWDKRMDAAEDVMRDLGIEVDDEHH